MLMFPNTVIVITVFVLTCKKIIIIILDNIMYEEVLGLKSLGFDFNSSFHCNIYHYSDKGSLVIN